VTDVGLTISDCSWVASSSTSLAVTVVPVTPGPPTLKTAVPEVVSSSWAAARVTVCGSFQLLGVKVRLAPEATVRSSSPLTLVVFTVTVELGADVRRAVKVAVPPSGTATEVAEVSTAGVSAVSPQVTPLIANDSGGGLLPLQVPLKPMEVLAPVPRLPFHGMLWAVTRVPDWLQVALQPCSRRWLVVGKSKVSVHSFSGSPRFSMVIAAVNPPLEPLLQSLEVYWTSQATAACAAVVCPATRPKAATHVAVAVTAHLRRPRGIFTSHQLQGEQRLTWERSQ